MLKPNLTEDQQNSLLRLAGKLEKDMDKVESYTFKKVAKLQQKLNDINNAINQYTQELEKLNLIGARTIGEYEGLAEAYMELEYSTDEPVTVEEVIAELPANND